GPAAIEVVSPRHEPIVENETQPGAMETTQQTAKRAKSLPTQTVHSPCNAVPPDRQRPQSDSSPTASTGGPTARPPQRAQGRGGPLGSATLLRRSCWLSRRLSRPDLPGGAPGHPESALPPNHYQLGHPSVDRAPRVCPGAPGLALAPGPLYQRPHLDDRYQYRLGPGQNSRRVGLGCPPPSARTRLPGSPSCSLYRRGGGRVLDRRHHCGVAQATHRSDGPPRRLSQR